MAVGGMSRSHPIWTSLALAAFAASGSAEWTPVTDIPARDVFTVWANGDTLVAGADSVVYISTDAGAAWKPSTQVVAGAQFVRAAFVRNSRLYAGTQGQGVFISDDLGDNWIDY